MADILTAEKRSWNMSRIKSGDTRPELAVRKMLHALGYRFRLHSKDLPGRPDIILPKYETVIFVHGCFWHRHRGCRYAYTPKSREGFWKKKFERNTARDKEVIQSLQELGWNITVIWECETRNSDSLKKILLKSLSCPPTGK